MMAERHETGAPDPALERVPSCGRADTPRRPITVDHATAPRGVCKKRKRWTSAARWRRRGRRRIRAVRSRSGAMNTVFAPCKGEGTHRNRRAAGRVSPNPRSVPLSEAADPALPADPEAKIIARAWRPPMAGDNHPRQRQPPENARGRRRPAGPFPPGQRQTRVSPGRRRKNTHGRTRSGANRINESRRGTDQHVESWFPSAARGTGVVPAHGGPRRSIAAIVQPGSRRIVCLLAIPGVTGARWRAGHDHEGGRMEIFRAGRSPCRRARARPLGVAVAIVPAHIRTGKTCNRARAKL